MAEGIQKIDSYTLIISFFNARYNYIFNEEMKITFLMIDSKISR
jgi:hypothetical protein